MDTSSHLPETDLGRLVDHVSRRLLELPAARVAGAEAEVRACIHELADLSRRAAASDAGSLNLPAERAWGHVVAVLGGDLRQSLAASPYSGLEARAEDVLRRLRRLLP